MSQAVWEKCINSRKWPYFEPMTIEDVYAAFDFAKQYYLLEAIKLCYEAQHYHSSPAEIGEKLEKLRDER